MAIESLIPKFHFTRVLKSETNTKTVTLLGQIEGRDAIVSLEKCHFNMASLDAIPIQISELSTDVTNDIYQWGIGTLISSLPEYPDFKVSLIYPATKTHIMKYDTQKFHVVEETPEIYNKVVVPYIETMIGDRLQWVRNILYDGAEAERVAYREEGDHGFVLLPDMKWDGINIEQLYLVLIVNRKDIRSLRDLNISHSDYLRGLLSKIREVVPLKYGIHGDQLRLFVHYQPSYYHFHVHVVNVEHPGLGDGITAGKAILLEDVIEQLNWLGEEGFQKKTITYVLGENHQLWKAIKANPRRTYPQIARAIIRMKSGNKRVLLGFEDLSETSEREQTPMRHRKVPKVLFKPQQYKEGGDEDRYKAEDQRPVLGGDDTDDYLKMKIFEDETNQQKRPGPEDQPKFALARDDTITRMKTSLFGQMIADDPTDPVIRQLPNMPVKSKGLSIMEKMGFKVGEALGRDPSNSGAMLEPIVMIPKPNKRGLGRGDDETDIQVSRGMTEKDEESFKSRLQLERDSERKERIVKKMQRLCLELTDQDIDIQKVLLKDLNVMWRGYVRDLQESWKKKRLIQNEKEVEEIDNSPEDDNQENKDEDVDDELDMFEAEPINTRIGRLYRHLRSEFDYCFWCGVRYKDQADLHANCPGETEEEHL